MSNVPEDDLALINEFRQLNDSVEKEIFIREQCEITSAIEMKEFRLDDPENTKIVDEILKAINLTSNRAGQKEVEQFFEFRLVPLLATFPQVYSVELINTMKNAISGVSQN